jgi:hypothetical protein
MGSMNGVMTMGMSGLPELSQAVISYCISALAGLAVAFAIRKPRSLGEALELLALSLGGVLLLLIGLGGVNAIGPVWLKSLAGEPLLRFGAVGVFVALGGALWGIVRQTARDAEGMNFFEVLSWARGKKPRTRKEK